MGRTVRALVLAAVTCAAIFTSAAPAGAEGGGDDEPRFSALVFSKTAAFRHDSIPAGVAAIRRLAVEHGFTVDATEDASAFTDANLARYDVVVWLSTTGDVLDEAQQAAFERYIRPAADTRESMPPRTPSTTGRGTAGWSPRTSATTLGAG